MKITRCLTIPTRPDKFLPQEDPIVNVLQVDLKTQDLNSKQKKGNFLLKIQKNSKYFKHVGKFFLVVAKIINHQLVENLRRSRDVLNLLRIETFDLRRTLQHVFAVSHQLNNNQGN